MFVLTVDRKVLLGSKNGFPMELTTENVYNLTIYFWSHVEISLSLELNHIGP